MTEEQQVALDEQLGHDAQKTLELLGDFDEQYTKAIVSNILSCDPKDFGSWRSLLKAKDAFVAYLTDKVRDGELLLTRCLRLTLTISMMEREMIEVTTWKKNC